MAIIECSGVAEVIKELDLLIVGSGLGGVCAAIAGVQLGCRVGLLWDSPTLADPYCMSTFRQLEERVREGVDYPLGLVGELLFELLARRLEGENLSLEAFFKQRIVREDNLFFFAGVKAKRAIIEPGGRIHQVIARAEGTGQSVTIQAPLVIDATGEGRIAKTAGADYELEQQLSARPKDYPSLAPSNNFKFRYQSLLQTVADSQFLYQEACRCMTSVWRFHTHSRTSAGSPLTTPQRPHWGSPRSLSWRFIGDYTLSLADLILPAPFSDQVFSGIWQQSRVGRLETIFAPDPNPCWGQGVFSVPFRCLYARNIPNLLLANRNISAVMPLRSLLAAGVSGALLGQAVGTAGYLCWKLGLEPRQLVRGRYEVLQKLLLQNNVPLEKLPGMSLDNLVGLARISASSAGPKAQPEHLLTATQTSRQRFWAPDPTTPLPQYVQLDFGTPRAIRGIQLSFAPPPVFRRFSPDLPKRAGNYRIACHTRDGWYDLVHEENNCIPYRLHHFAGLKTGGLRFYLLPNQYATPPRLYELRVYGED